MRLPLLLAVSFAFAGSASAQLFPPVPQQGTVYDGAGLLTPDEERSISDLSRDFQQATGAPIVVATLPSLAKVEAKEMGIERYSAQLFNQWRIGRSSANGGILLVVAKEDRKVRIELGRDWRHDYDASAQDILRKTILPSFKAGKLSQGIIQGSQALAHLADRPVGASGPAGTPIQQMPFGSVDGGSGSSDSGIGGLVCIGVPIVGFVLLLLFASNRRRRYDSRFDNGPNGYNGYDNTRDDSGAFVAGVVAGQMMSQPTYDPTPFDAGNDFDSGGGFDSGGSFDSGDSGGGGASGDW